MWKNANKIYRAFGFICRLKKNPMPCRWETQENSIDLKKKINYLVFPKGNILQVFSRDDVKDVNQN